MGIGVSSASSDGRRRCWDGQPCHPSCADGQLDFWHSCLWSHTDRDYTTQDADKTTTTNPSTTVAPQASQQTTPDSPFEILALSSPLTKSHFVDTHDPHRDGFGSASSSGSDIEIEELADFQEVPARSLARRKGKFCTKFGQWNRRIISDANLPDVYKTPDQLLILEEVIQKDALFRSAVDLQHEEMIAKAMELKRFEKGQAIVQLGQEAKAFYIVLEGSVHCTSSTCGKSERILTEGEYFGDEALLWHVPWSRTMTAGSDGCLLGALSRSLYQRVVVEANIKEWDRRTGCLHKCKLLETLNDDQIGKLTEVLKLRKYHKGDIICRQGQMGHHFFIVESGVVSEFATPAPMADVVGGNHMNNGDCSSEFGRQHALHQEGDLVGEEALLKAAPREHTLIAETEVEVLVLSRGKFKRLLGSMSDLHEEHQVVDPRWLIADYYKAGNVFGPKGKVKADASRSCNSFQDLPKEKTGITTNWFAIFRPTSRDAITKLISGQGVGKGLNVKGKSAKKGVLSGFVPFLQICDNSHKHAIEASPPESYFRVFYRNDHAREEARVALKKVHVEQKVHLHYDKVDAPFEELVTDIDTCIPQSYGLLMPEVLLHEAYIELEDLTPHAGWETGRKSEPAYMDMNFHSIRDGHKPLVVLWQFDEGHPMNGHGLLIAYWEEMEVRPVVSDFDAFIVGSCNMDYQPVPDDQVELAKWSLERTEDILKEPKSEGWTSRWLDVLHDLAEQGQHHEFPELGYGDETSIALFKEKISCTSKTGAIRHGAECFNFHFPQELDDELLVVWEGFITENQEPWRYYQEPEVRQFLMARAKEGYAFPLNPVWPVRDKGWYEVLQALRENPAVAQPLSCWYPTKYGVLDMIDRLHKTFPEGFSELQKPDGFAKEQLRSCASMREDAELILHQAKRKANKEPVRKKAFRELRHGQHIAAHLAHDVVHSGSHFAQEILRTVSMRPSSHSTTKENSGGRTSNNDAPQKANSAGKGNEKPNAEAASNGENSTKSVGSGKSRSFLGRIRNSFGSRR